MSISFTPTQLHVIQLAMTEAESIEWGEYTSTARKELDNMYPPCDVPFPSKWGTEWAEDAYETSLSIWRKQDAIREREFEGSILLIYRAYVRFRKEFEHYTAGRCKLGVVREYHALLIDTLAPFLR